MATACIPQVTFEFYEKLNPVVARFDKAQASTDGCAVLLKALDERLRLTDRLAACVSDRRDLDKIRHATRDLLRQRIMGLACFKLAVWVEGSVRRSFLHLPQFAPWGARMATGGRGGGRHAGLTARPVSPSAADGVSGHPERRSCDFSSSVMIYIDIRAQVRLKVSQWNISPNQQEP